MNKQKIIGISGYSGSGKTTLLKKIITLLVEQNFKVGSLKHAHHDIEVDIPGKDSYQLRKAGSLQTIVACDERYAVICETPNKPTDLITLINQFNDIDIILIEGFKHEKIPKIICHRKANKKALYIDEFTIAVASDGALETSLPVLDINQPLQIVEFIKSYLFKQ
ncbi:molybdopterin-guanine dinucleotide biosynthesis protein B [Gilliamella sp. Pas-s25]|uniref:molybdopterin-guanine dinucleotide biosynthesis protein B n=1 Tax=Gilliamella sp. Pas-s25 TaxID=2687310 RepID=UPI00135D74BE|nr:molybdopterin-guanine dinucleotide biosynthesis protein B [Gilliamella sp. Pas-s25]MWP62686.1 molybdopterin-guanine dinucleotide biosynthesis protein B [Gilliamella sp. Pas-s25]